MTRFSDDVPDISDLDDLSEVHDRNAAVARDVARRGQIVRNVDEGHPEFFVEFLHEIEQGQAQRNVDHADGLVRNDEPGLERDGARHENALTLSAESWCGYLVRNCAEG